MKEGHIQADKLEELLYQDTAFKGYDNPAAMCKAADYTDEWLATDKSHFRAYYFCRSKNAWFTPGGGQHHPDARRMRHPHTLW